MHGGADRHSIRSQFKNLCSYQKGGFAASGKGQIDLMWSQNRDMDSAGKTVTPRALLLSPGINKKRAGITVCQPCTFTYPISDSMVSPPDHHCVVSFWWRVTDFYQQPETNNQQRVKPMGVRLDSESAHRQSGQ